jgi:cytochrome b561
MADLSKVNLEELKKKEKALKTAFIVILSMVVIMLIAGIYLTIVDGPGAILFLPVAFTPIVLTNYMNLKKVRQLIAEKEQGN